MFLSLEGIIDLASMKKGAWKRVLSRDVARRRWKLTLREKMCGAAFRVKYATGGRVNFTMATECSTSPLTQGQVRVFPRDLCHLCYFIKLMYAK